MIKTVLTAAALSLATISAPVLAGDEAAPKMKVSIGDLNLSTPEGQDRLDRRIHHAAQQVCKVNDVRTGTRIPSAERKQCYEKAVKSVQSQVATIIQEQQRGG